MQGAWRMRLKSLITGMRPYGDPTKTSTPRKDCESRIIGTGRAAVESFTELGDFGLSAPSALSPLLGTF